MSANSQQIYAFPKLWKIDPSLLNLTVGQLFQHPFTQSIIQHEKENTTKKVVHVTFPCIEAPQETIGICFSVPNDGKEHQMPENTEWYDIGNMALMPTNKSKIDVGRPPYTTHSVKDLSSQFYKILPKYNFWRSEENFLRCRQTLERHYVLSGYVGIESDPAGENFLGYMTTNTKKIVESQPENEGVQFRFRVWFPSSFQLTSERFCETLSKVIEFQEKEKRSDPSLIYQKTIALINVETFFKQRLPAIAEDHFFRVVTNNNANFSIVNLPNGQQHLYGGTKEKRSFLVASTQNGFKNFVGRIVLENRIPEEKTQQKER